MKARILVLVLVVIAAFAGNALATPIIGTITAETARGVLSEDLRLRSRFDNGASVKVFTRGAIEVITQRIVADPGASFGWHSHPGENVNVGVAFAVAVNTAKQSLDEMLAGQTVSASFVRTCGVPPPPLTVLLTAPDGLGAGAPWSRAKA